MLVIAFSGWFQCRLATDPDPYDETRGVSGYVSAYAGEPDLDRLICWQQPTFMRELAPAVGVTVKRVMVDDQDRPTSGLLGAPVNLLGNPKFEGRNGVIAEAGFEPINPVDLEIAKAGIRLRRSLVPFDPDYPYEGLGAAGVDTSGAREIATETGIPSLFQAWADRIGSLSALGDIGEPRRTAVEERLAFLQSNLGAGGGPARFFGARMNYSYDLNSPAPIVDGLASDLNFEPELSDEWRVQFWLGGWDADVLCGFCKGMLIIPSRAGPVLPKQRELPAGINRDLV